MKSVARLVMASLTVSVLTLLASTVHADVVRLYIPGSNIPDPPAPPTPLFYTEGQGSSRDAHFLVQNNPLQVKGLTILFNPLDNIESTVGTTDGSITVRWRLYASDFDRTVGSLLYDSGDILFTDEGMKQYHHPVDLNLSSVFPNNFYILSLGIVTGAFQSPRYENGSFTTEGGEILVLNGGQNNNAFGGGTTNWNNSITPAFILIPEPASLALLVGGTLLILRRSGH